MTWAGVCLGPPTAGNSPAIFYRGGVIMGKILSIFIDESGDVGFIKDASKYYIITFVMHNQNDDIKSNIEKIKDYPIFHAGPIIRREYPFDNMEMKDRKKTFQSIFMFTLSLPIKIFSFCYEKKDFNGDLLKMQAKITKDVYNFLLDNFDYLNSFNEIIIYYDNGQNLITKILNGAFAISGLNYEFKKEVVPGSYRLFQVADFVSTVKLLEMKLNKNELSNSELIFVDVYHLKKNYIKGVNKKVLKK